MKCDDFLSALETGGSYRRWQARRHAARCPQCAAVQKAFDEAMGHWAAAEPLAPRARQAWTHAAEEIILRPGRRKVPRRVAAGFGVAACALLFFLVMMVRKEASPLQPGADLVQIFAQKTY